MTEQAVVEYVANCAWQVPLLAGGAWAMVKLARPALRTEYWLWVAVLAMAVVLPMRGVERRGGNERRTAIVEVQRGAGSTYALMWADGSFLRGEERPVTLRERIATLRSELGSGAWSGWRGFRLQMSARGTHWFVGVYVLAMLFAGLRLFGAWRRARLLVRDGQEMSLGDEAMRSLQEVAYRMGVEVPEIRESHRIAGPMVVGALRPVLLLPEGAGEYGEDELRAAIAHELAHVKRRDYLVNLLCEAVMLPVSWHPVANAVEQRIQQTREMVCDEMAAEEMESGEGYARCLVSVTRRIMERPVAFERTQAVGFFDRNTLEERVMRLTAGGEMMTGRSKAMRVVCGGLALATVVGVAATFHVKPAFGAEAVGQSSAAVTAAASNKAAAGVVQVQPVKPSALVVEGDTVAATEVQGHPSAPVAIARGKHATVTAEPGEYVHRWKTHDGEAFAMVNHEATEPSEEEQQAVEEKLDDIHAGADPAVIRLDWPEVKLDWPEVKLDLKKLQIDKVQIEKAQRLMNDPAMKKQFAELQRKGMLDAQKQIAELRINPPDINLSNLNLELQMQSAKDALDRLQVEGLADSQIKLIDEAKINAEIAEGMKGNAAAMAKLRKEMDSGELKAKLEAAQKLLDEVQRKMEAMQKEKK
ncbi:beta-lactamase regulating signal transducer with metallopeptidase domain [Granulicella aggregans]|uniref:Beta-lactamase regulating signal transducer with metallopeptidase domain n=1 Tax=Granulicella aggregans TaxID=474949 RepID=A0A7W7ZCR0_9BACT|nr:M56 family metallopeptidase [Granulicella aggregans]MBB5057343.1 beta-lactamase regulating signal transducer with metallopeptidase domain [Granulicella aggregans]